MSLYSLKAQKRHPYLNHSENNWATDVICHQYFRNHHRHVIKAVNKSTSVGFAAVQAQLEGAGEDYIMFTRHVALRAAIRLALLAYESLQICF